MFKTILAGVILYVCSQLFHEYFLDPIKKYRQVVTKIDNRLKFYSNIITSPGDQVPKEIMIECNTEIRNLSCELESAYRQLLIRKNSKNIYEAATILIGLSNRIFWSGTASHNSDDIDRIRKLLKLERS